MESVKGRDELKTKAKTKKPSNIYTQKVSFSY